MSENNAMNYQQPQQLNKKKNYRSGESSNNGIKQSEQLVPSEPSITGTIVQYSQKPSLIEHDDDEVLSRPTLTELQTKNIQQQTDQIKQSISQARPLLNIYKNSVRMGKIRKNSNVMNRTMQHNYSHSPKNQITFRSFQHSQQRNSICNRYQKSNGNENGNDAIRRTKRHLGFSTVQKQKTKQYQLYSQQNTKNIPISTHTKDNIRMLRRKAVSKISIEILQGTIVHQMNNPEKKQLPQSITMPKIYMPMMKYGPKLKTTPQQICKMLRNFSSFLKLNLDKAKWMGVVLKKYQNCIMFSSQQYQFLWYYSGTLQAKSTQNNQQLEFVPQKYCYLGQFSNKFKQGKGIQIDLNGSIYDGEWANGRRNGYGKSYDADKCVSYQGQWQNDYKEGEGVLQKSCKQYYKGTFKKSKKSGFGVQHFKNGDHYEGYYNQGKFQGKGKYFWADGSYYWGSFYKGKLQGKGQWHSQGKCYIGDFEADMRQGYGKLIENDGSAFQGYFKKGYKHGQGTVHQYDGYQFNGIWQYGKIITNHTDSIDKLRSIDPAPLETPLMQTSSRPLRRSIGLQVL